MRFGMEAGAGIEPAIEVLQTSALPLGDPAVSRLGVKLDGGRMGVNLMLANEGVGLFFPPSRGIDFKLHGRAVSPRSLSGLRSRPGAVRRVWGGKEGGWLVAWREREAG
jgi:hypothetical protein